MQSELALINIVKQKKGKATVIEVNGDTYILQPNGGSFNGSKSTTKTKNESKRVEA